MIYGLIEKETGQLYYVGRTVNLSNRKAVHKHYAKIEKDQSPKGQWIREIGVENFEVVVIEDSSENEGQDELWWIEYFEFLGCNLLNVCEYETGCTSKKAPIKFNVTENIKEMMGEVPDSEIAEKFDVSRVTVRNKRDQLNIEPFQPAASERKAGEVKWLIQNTNRTLADIGREYDDENLPYNISQGNSHVNVDPVEPLS